MNEIAYHEAGHCGVAMLLGLEVRRASAMAQDASVETRGPKPRTRHEAIVAVEQNLVVGLSGSIAESLLSGEPYATDPKDEAHVFRLARQLARLHGRLGQDEVADLSEIHMAVDYFRRSTWSIVADNLVELRQLAKALEGRALTGDELSE